MEQQKIKLRLERLIGKTFRVHSEDSFDNPEAEAVILGPIPDYDAFVAARDQLQSEIHAVAHELRGFYEEPLLTREQEHHWFRQYNFLKHKAFGVVQAVGEEPTEADLEAVEELFGKAAIIKRQLAGSNLRLVMNLAKKQREYKENPNIDLLAEIVSDGYVGLMRGVDHFDYRLGNKFSTYATWAILDTMKRSRKARHKHAICVNVSEEVMNEVHDEEEPAENLPIEKFLDKIPARNRRVLVEYFGLKGHDASTLQEIGDNMGLSKERIRQLREEGLRKMKGFLLAKY